MILIKANETSAGRRRVFFQLVDASDGITPETGEAGGQPQLSINGGAWSDTGIGTLNAVGHGRYYAEVTSTAVATAGTIIETRYKSTNTAECPGDSIQVVAFDPHDTAALGLSRLDATISSRSTYAGSDTSGVTTLLSRIPDTLSLASINTQLDTALAEYDPPTHSEMTAAFTQIKGDDWSSSTDSLTAIAQAVDAASETSLTAEDIASAVWDKELADHSEAGSAGAGLAAAGSAGDPWATMLPGSYSQGQAGQIIGDFLDAAISSRSSHSASDVAELILAEPDYPLLTDASGRVTVGSNADKNNYHLATAPPTADAIAQEVWEATSRTLTGFSFLAAGDIAQSVIAQDLTGPHDAGTVGQVLSDLNHKIIRMGQAK